MLKGRRCPREDTVYLKIKVLQFDSVPVWEKSANGEICLFTYDFGFCLFAGAFTFIHSLTGTFIHSHSLTHPLIYYSLIHHSLIHSNPPFLPSSRIVFLLFCVDIFLDLTLWVFSCLGQAVSRVILL